MSTLLDAEPVLVEQADDTPRCEWKRVGGCDHEAIWSLLSSCGCTRNVCREHDAVAVAREEGLVILHCDCGAKPVHLVGRIRI